MMTVDDNNDDHDEDDNNVAENKPSKPREARIQQQRKQVNVDKDRRKKRRMDKGTAPPHQARHGATPKNDENKVFYLQ